MGQGQKTGIPKPPGAVNPALTLWRQIPALRRETQAPALDVNCRLGVGRTKTWVISHGKLNCRNLLEIILNLV